MKPRNYAPGNIHPTCEDEDHHHHHHQHGIHFTLDPPSITKLIEFNTHRDHDKNHIYKSKPSIKKHLIFNNLFHHRLWWLIYFLVQATLMSLYFTLNWKEKFSMGSITVANLLVDEIIRNEIFVTILHRITVKIPIFKYFFNRMLHSIGGLHVGCGISIGVWNFLDIIINGFEDRTIHMYNKITSLIILILISIICVTALPTIRRSNHDLFENFHRYVGWVTLILLLSQLIVLDILNSSINKRNPGLYMTVIIFIIVIQPWCFVRRIPIEMHSPSQQCTVITMKNIKEPRYHGRFLRISKNLIEWHAFAIALSYPEKKEIKIVIASAGDWTKKIIAKSESTTENQTHKIWLRKIFGTGFMYSIYAYKRVMIVATGSGIAPVLPYIQTPVVDSFILWIAKDHEKTFGKDLMSLIEPHESKIRMVDTRVNGRPSVEMIFDCFNEIKTAEAIFVVSNEKFTNETINASFLKGIHCYGAMFDS